MKSKAEANQLSLVDPIWQEIVQGAEQVAQDEPSLSGFIFSNILNHGSFEDALAFRLAQRLHHEDVSADLIRQAFDDVGDAISEIGQAARVDIAATKERDPACDRAIEPFLYFKGFQALQTHRFAHVLHKLGRNEMALYLQSRSSQVFQVDINPAVKVGRGIMIDHGTGVVVGETATIGDQVSILQNVTLGGNGKEHNDRHPKVGNCVLLGAGAKVLGNISIGECARVAAGSVVLKDVPARTTVAGVPAKIVGQAGSASPGESMNHVVDGAAKE